MSDLIEMLSIFQLLFVVLFDRMTRLGTGRLFSLFPLFLELVDSFVHSVSDIELLDSINKIIDLTFYHRVKYTEHMSFPSSLVVNIHKIVIIYS